MSFIMRCLFLLASIAACVAMCAGTATADLLAQYEFNEAVGA